MGLIKTFAGLVVVLAFSLAGQALLRKGVTSVLDGRTPPPLEFVRNDFLSVLFSPAVITGVVLCGIGAMAYLYVLSACELGRAVPILGGLACIASFFIGRIFLNEQSTWVNFVGIALLVTGLYLVSLKAA